MTEKLTEEEHIARAMLMGMRYHHGNGEPFYFKDGSDGIPDTMSFIDAETLKPLMSRTNLGYYHMHGKKAARQHDALWAEWGAGNLRKNK